MGDNLKKLKENRYVEKKLNRNEEMNRSERSRERRRKEKKG